MVWIFLALALMVAWKLMEDSRWGSGIAEGRGARGGRASAQVCAADRPTAITRSSPPHLANAGSSKSCGVRLAWLGSARAPRAARWSASGVPVPTPGFEPDAAAVLDELLDEVEQAESALPAAPASTTAPPTAAPRDRKVRRLMSFDTVT